MRGPLLLALILVAAALLRFYDLEAAAPGINPDEAANAWNAWCLLTTGRDQVGEPWPIFHFRTIGDHRSPLFIYLLLPFQALLGMSIWSTRAANATFGVALVGLCYWLGKRLWDRPTGLWAAGIAAVVPWTVQLSRWGHEGSITGLLCAIPIAGLLWARVLDAPSGAGGGAPQGWRRWAGVAVGLRALPAGVVSGLACYGYPAVRVFVPLWLLLIGPLWLAALRRSESRRAVVLWWVGFALPFGPLAWQHAFHSDQISRRAAALWAWAPDDSPARRIEIVATRYVAHFGPRFLFERGDEYPESWHPGLGVLNAAVGPLVVIGVLSAARARGRADGSPRAGVRARQGAIMLAAWLLAYPVADSLSKHVSPHAMRAMPGVGAFVLLGALGARRAFAWTAQRRLGGHSAVAVSFLLVIGGADLARLLRVEFVERRRSPLLRQYRQADLVAVGQWLRPRLEAYGRIDVSMTDANVPYIVLLVALDYDPRRWHAESREIELGQQWDVVHAFGRVRFLTRTSPREAWEALLPAEAERVALVARRYEIADAVPVFAAHAGPDALCVFERP